MMTGKPFVSVVIPSYNSKAYIFQCLECIFNQSYPRELYEVIVVDNASTDDSPSIIKSFPVQYLYEPKKGPSAARNTGIRHARGKYFLFIDTDCLAGKDLIKTHIEAHLSFMKKNPAVKIVGGGIDGLNKNYWAMCDNFCSWYLNHPRLEPRIENRHLPTANLSVDRCVFEKTGLFNEELRFGEDSMFCRQARENGYLIYFEPKAVVRHINRTSFKHFMSHAKEWSEVGKYSELETIDNKPVKINSPVLVVLYNIYYFFFRFVQLSYAWLSKGKLSFVLCLPGVLLNKIYFGFHMVKARYYDG
ncbi:MAG: glycosyltransferase [Clostridiaceae bacterium]|jgi:glycosyltransferase involved in cell wall biosynthesis|nr:glycosyltransferase [Clostridiaceae bacterium]